MESNEVSIHQVKIYMAVKAAGEAWMTSHEIADKSGVAGRTARHHALKLVQLGIFDLAEVFPGHRYRLAKTADKRNKAYLLRLENAKDVFGIAGIN